MKDSNLVLETKEREEVNFSLSFSLDEKASTINETEVWNKVQLSLLSLLAKTFNENNKRSIKIHTDRFSISCPYCGDSSTDTLKKRGNLFFDTASFHCFNGDCNIHKSIHSLLKDFSEDSKFTQEELQFMNSRLTDNLKHREHKRIRIYQSIESLISEEAMNLTVSREFFVNKLRLQEISQSRVKTYMQQRLQSNLNKFAFDPRKGCIYVFNLTTDGQRILGFQIKTFNKRAPYLTYKTCAMHEYLGILKPENVELLEKVDTISTAFGILELNLNKSITVFEGPLDSFLFPNSVGVCSAKNDFPFEVEQLRYFYDNDKTGKEWSLRRLNEGYPVFLWKKFLAENELSQFESKIKDLNDLLIMIRRNKLKLKRFADYFSTDHYDAYWV